MQESVSICPNAQSEPFRTEKQQQQQGPTAEVLPGGSSSALPGQEKEFPRRLCGLIADLRRSSCWRVRRRVGWRTPEGLSDLGGLTRQVPTAFPHVPLRWGPRGTSGP